MPEAPGFCCPFPTPALDKFSRNHWRVRSLAGPTAYSRPAPWPLAGSKNFLGDDLSHQEFSRMFADLPSGPARRQSLHSGILPMPGWSHFKFKSLTISGSFPTLLNSPFSWNPSHPHCKLVILLPMSLKIQKQWKRTSLSSHHHTCPHLCFAFLPVPMTACLLPAKSTPHGTSLVSSPGHQPLFKKWYIHIILRLN